jgi:CRISPR system Cascade subunit CasA
MHLIHDPWLPVTMSDGSCARIRPCELVQQTVVDVDAPRADLAIAARTFLIGLVTTAGLANNEGDWQRLYDSPPTADALMASLQRYERAFQLFGDGPRFCQHQAVVQDDDWLRIASILIDGPNKESDDRNRDVMTDIVAFSPAIAALALYALQQLAPSGGRGHRQSMRGGSPMSTLVAGGSTLWHAIWLNVETRDQLAARSPKQWPDRADVADIFPWMGKVRTSEDGLETTTSDAHPLQVYWQMPRLLWLDAGAGGADRCGLTGEGSNVLVRGFYRAYRGINYSADWRHPHMPHVRGKDGIQPARAFSRAARVGDWLGVVYRDQNGDREPASVVTACWELALMSCQSSRFNQIIQMNCVLSSRDVSFLSSALPTCYSNWRRVPRLALRPVTQGGKLRRPKPTE